MFCENPAKQHLDQTKLISKLRIPAFHIGVYSDTKTSLIGEKDAYTKYSHSRMRFRKSARKLGPRLKDFQCFNGESKAQGCGTWHKPEEFQQILS
jgi:hypothetical protein